MSARKPSLFARARAWFGRGKRPTTGTRVFSGAAFNRLTADWYTHILSADQELKADLRRLRGAARALVRDDPYGARFPQLMVENVIGPNTPQLQMQDYTTRGTPATRVNEAVELEFNNWAYEKRWASADGRLCFNEQLQLIVRSLAVDGEVLLRHIRMADDNPYGYAVQVIDADLLDEQLGMSAPVKLPNGNQIVLGVEMEPRFQRPVAYWLWTQHPSETGGLSREHTRVPADEIEHLYIVQRMGQTRGIPWFAPVMLVSKMAGGFEEAAITAARAGASSSYGVTYDPEKASGIDTTHGGDVPLELSPGIIPRFAPGEAPVALPMEYPSAVYGPFIKNIRRSMATGLNVSYTSLSGDLEAVNYSSIRAGLLSERDFYRLLQQFVGRNVCRPVFREWAKFAALMGRIPAREVDRYVVAASWKFRGWTWVDPRNDVDAASKAVAEGFRTRSDICAEQGTDFEENIDRLAEENAYAAAAGVSLGEVPKAAAATTEDPEDDDNGSEDEEKEDGNAAARRLRLARSLG